jgi:hypothetical protein
MIPFRFCLPGSVLIFVVSGLFAIVPERCMADDPREELEILRERVNALEQFYREETAELEERIGFLEDKVLASVETSAAPQAQRANIFNPQTTVFGNFIGRADSKRVENEEGESIDDRFNLREVEIDFRSAIDPWADGVVIAAFESEAPGDYVAEIEEGYIVFKKLPLFDAAPWGLKLKAGRFRPEFGRFNKIHTHDLPHTTLPLVLKSFLGEEGFIQNGLSGQLFLPLPSERSVFEATIEIMNGGELPAASDNTGGYLAYLGHLKWFLDIAAGQDIEVGGSAYTGKTDDTELRDVWLYGFDFTYKWKPMGRGEWHSFLLGGELVFVSVEGAVGPVGDPFGYYLWSQFQFNRRTYLGFRYDYTEKLEEDHLDRSISTYLSYYTTEFLRIRTGYEHMMSDDRSIDGRDTVYLEINFVFGSHFVEPYWVNR